ncbi:MAG: PAS domain-containing protein [Desulfobacteraceae bacterium]|nr:PAS domain-containing protein [Desulfobacteraceae bacterium]
MMLQQIFDMIDVGLVILDRQYRVCYWNRWLEIHSGLAQKEIRGKSLFDFYPHLRNKKFLRNFKAVVTFGNCYFFPQKLHEYIFPFKPESNFVSEIDYMQQSCIMGPLRNKQKVIEYAYISVKDVTEAHIYETKLTSALFSLLEKNLGPESISPQVRSVLPELLSCSNEDFCVAPSTDGKPQSVEDQIMAMLSTVKQK